MSLHLSKANNTELDTWLRTGEQNRKTAIASTNSSYIEKLTEKLNTKFCYISLAYPPGLPISPLSPWSPVWTPHVRLYYISWWIIHRDCCNSRVWVPKTPPEDRREMYCPTFNSLWSSRSSFSCGLKDQQAVKERTQHLTCMSHDHDAWISGAHVHTFLSSRSWLTTEARVSWIT